MPLPRISVIGLGKVGSAMVASYASRGFEVVGSDRDQRLVDAVGRHTAPFEEQDLAKLLSENAARIRTTGSTAEAVAQTDITFIIVPTPSAPDGSFATKYVESACADIGAALKAMDRYHLVVVVSTMLPMDTQERILPVLEGQSGKKAGVDFGYCYSPSFIAIGSIVRNILYPDFFLVGEFDKRSGDTVESFYTKMRVNDASVERMSIESAELTKIALNSYVTQKITFANLLADICSKLPNADVDSVTTALGKDRRIGAAYLKGGMGYGGPCFPRDNKAFSQSASRYGVMQQVAEHVHAYNESIIDKVYERAFASMPKTSTIAVLGLSYKPNTYLTDEAQGLKMVQKLVKEGHSVIWYDPPPAAAREETPASARRIDTLKEAVDASDACFISYPSEEFDELPKLLAGRAKAFTLIDPDRRYRGLSGLAAHINYVPFGIGKRTRS